uniref:Cytochrome c oxidase assembly factor 1 n=1 Tax=Panagrolaimus sp. ES5 TaxID=591445 RepID=A0AC34G3A4_9BILA
VTKSMLRILKPYPRQILPVRYATHGNVETGVLKKVQTTTLLQIAGGTFLLGATALYFAQKRLQDRVRSLPHYKEAFKIIGNHDAVKRLLGPPIAIGRVNLADRHNNFRKGDAPLKLRIPVSGTLSSGFLNVHAVRKNGSAEFETNLIQLETPDSNIVVYDNPNALR